MQIAIVLYPGFTALDVVGPYEVLARLPGAEVVFVAERPGLVRNDLGSLSIDAVAGLDEVTRPDVVVIGGGPGQANQMSDGPLHSWLRSADTHTTWTMSVCTGSLILAAAGLLRGRRATTHWRALEQLTQFGASPSEDRVVVDGNYLIGAGVSAGIDAALTLAGKIAGDATAQAVQLLIEYDPRPPYSAGSTSTAPASVIREAEDMLTSRR
ncbi:DJ-1/PfpI family protein [Mycobacterium sp. NPDC006124]|uniref:DJ-1/PfpI family protein n=1 Tax=Mycobacterium sp. NPDC006124 TaxID=3156729 RepID=UPI0033A3734C